MMMQYNINKERRSYYGKRLNAWFYLGFNESYKMDCREKEIIMSITIYQGKLSKVLGFVNNNLFDSIIDSNHTDFEVEKWH